MRKTNRPAAAATTTPARFEIVKNGPRDGERETRTGRIVRYTITTWDIVDTATCGLVNEFYTRREARAALASLLARRAAPPVVGDFITVPAWKASGQVIATRPASLGTDDAIEVLLETEPDDPQPRWYRLEPSEFTIDA